ncbi:rrna-processing protein utp23 [Diplodia corticola]|uniref:U three protein 23 n=1 Tax=Diplodia corticola TaxID=236234 RepID=A0A1J9QJH0_9PEZI|nr:rrna-processing protein utp23 [Diplodia corticola]OJD28609.1 rrna-processing protein utp23 [Diplodia corticola]
MRGKRAKQYRKLMHQYALTFGFREPYQVLVDSEIVLDSTRMKMDLASYLERTLQGKVKPMITQCSMRHLYASKDQVAIGHAQAFERRRCNHHTLDEPLSTLDCVKSVLDPKDSKTNKHRYVVASQEQPLRSYLRKIPGVPLIYINRSVMIMEPMAGATEDVRDRTETEKFRAGLKTRPTAATAAPPKRKRGEDEDGSDEDTDMEDAPAQPEPKKKKKRTGPKAPNPLSAKKPKKRSEPQAQKKSDNVDKPAGEGTTSEEQAKRKRKRKNKAKADGEAPEQAEQVAQEA